MSKDTDREGIEQRALDSELTLSESASHEILDASPVAMALYDSHDCVVYLNPAFISIFGYTLNDIPTLDSWWPRAYPAEEYRQWAVEVWQSELDRSRRTGTAFTPIEATVWCKDGGERTMLVSAAALTGSLEGNHLVMFYDITERKRAQTALALSEEKFSTAFHTSPDAVNINRLSDGMYLDINEGFTRLTGYTTEDVEGRTSGDIAIWDDPADRDRLVAGLLANGIVHNLEARFRRKDGSVTTALMSAQTIEVGGVQCIMSVTRDISERKVAEEAQRVSEARHRAILETAMDGFWVVDTEGRLLEVNRAYCTMSGYAAQELLAMNIADLDAELSVGEITERIREIVTGGPTRFESRHRRKDGTFFDVEVSVKHSATDAGRLSSFLRDITEQKAAAAELQLRGERLEELLEERARHLEQLSRSLTSIIDVVGKVIEARDPYTAGHERRVSELAARISTDLGMPPAQVEEIRIAALIHDVGKITIPAEILSKPGRLSPVEFSLIKCHSEAGWRILASADMEGSIAEIVYQHHERCDGSGYPRGLPAEELLPESKVLMVADVVEAMVSHRPYREGLGIEAALAEIERGAGGLYDADVAASCVAVFRSGDFAFSEA